MTDKGPGSPADFSLGPTLICTGAGNVSGGGEEKTGRPLHVSCGRLVSGTRRSMYVILWGSNCVSLNTF